MEWKWNCLWRYGCNIWEFVVHFPNTKSGWSSENLNLRLQPEWYLVSSPLSSLLLLSPAFAASSIGGLASWTHDHGGVGDVGDDHVVVVVVMKVLWMMTMLQGLDIITVSQPCSVSQEWHGVTGYFCFHHHCRHHDNCSCHLHLRCHHLWRWNLYLHIHHQAEDLVIVDAWRCQFQFLSIPILRKFLAPFSKLTIVWLIWSAFCVKYTQHI